MSMTCSSLKSSYSTPTFELNDHDYSIEPASHQHITEIVRVVNEAYWRQTAEFFEDSMESRRTNPKEISSLINNNNANQTIYVVLKKSKEPFVVGTALYKSIEATKEVSLSLFSIDIPYQRGRAGQYLMTFLQCLAFAQKHKKIKFEVLSFSKALINYYGTIGAVLTGEKISFSNIFGCKLKPQYARDAYYVVMSSDLTTKQIETTKMAFEKIRSKL